ncbi:MAG: acyl carrier protein [Lachnospiraceae bacterium]|nr:acyl carrier protein [Lachnospiraceae bacterium]
MLEKLVEIIEEQLNVEGVEITEKTDFQNDLEADSLDLFELSMAIEEAFEVEIPSEELSQFTTVGSVIEYLKANGMELPGLVAGSDVKIAPIVSSKRALQVILRYWKKHYDRKPDLVVIEGPKAGGHLGFSGEELEKYETENYDSVIEEILTLTKPEGIPVVVAGGVYTRQDMEHCLALGADGVQLATRFVTTYECDAHPAYKQAYIDAKPEDIVIVKSPVGMPGRAIRNDFLEQVEQGNRFMKGCRKCITTCDPKTVPYCITQALINAVEGRVEEGLLFCGSNAYLATKLEHVQEIMEEFS